MGALGWYLLSLVKHWCLVQEDGYQALLAVVVQAIKTATEVLGILFTGLCRIFSHPSVTILKLKGQGSYVGDT